MDVCHSEIVRLVGHLEPVGEDDLARAFVGIYQLHMRWRLTKSRDGVKGQSFQDTSPCIILDRHRCRYVTVPVNLYFHVFFCIFLIFCQILKFLVKITWFFCFSNKNDAESSRSFIKNLVLDPKRAKLVQKSYGKFTESLRNLQRAVQEDPYMGPYGP